MVAVCTANGLNVNGELIRQGWAIEYRQYSDGRYADEEAEARLARRGLWAGEFVKPWSVRRGEQLPSQAAAGGERPCPIKGNISSSGRIYYVPGSTAYAKTLVDENSRASAGSARRMTPWPQGGGLRESSCDHPARRAAEIRLRDRQDAMVASSISASDLPDRPVRAGLF